MGDQAPGWIIWTQLGGPGPPSLPQSIWIQSGAWSPKVLAPWPSGAWFKGPGRPEVTFLVVWGAEPPGIVISKPPAPVGCLLITSLIVA